MQLQNDVSEIKTSIVECHSKQIRLIENAVATGTAGQLPIAISRGYAILVDATGREHTMLLDQCRYFDVRRDTIDIHVYGIQQTMSATGCHALSHPFSMQARRSRDPKVVHRKKTIRFRSVQQDQLERRPTDKGK
jgi:hypothetical protein